MRFRKFISPMSIVIFIVLAAGIANAGDADVQVNDIERVLSQARELFSTDNRPVLTGVVLSSSAEDVPGRPGCRWLQVTCEVEWKGERKTFTTAVPAGSSDGMTDAERERLWYMKTSRVPPGTSNDIEMRYLQVYYAPDVKVDVRFAPDNPETSSLIERTQPPRTPRKKDDILAALDWEQLIIWCVIGGISAAIVIALVIQWKAPKVYQTGRAVVAGIFLVGIFALGSLGLWMNLLHPLVKCWMSGSWRETACFIYDSDLVELEETPSGPFNTIRAVYTYPVGQKEFVSRTCCFNGEVSDFLDYRNQIQGKLQRHCYARCYVNPSNPADAVLIRSFKWPQGKALLNYLFFAVIWGAGAYGLVLAAWKRIRKRLWGSEASMP